MKQQYLKIFNTVEEYESYKEGKSKGQLPLMCHIISECKLIHNN